MAGAYRGAAGNHLPGATYHTLLGALAVFVPVFHGFQGPTRQVGSSLSCLCARLRNSQAHRRADTRSLSGPCFSRIVRQPSSYAGTVLLARGLLRKYVRAAEQNSHLSGWLFCLMASHWPPKLSYVVPAAAARGSTLLRRLPRRDLFPCCCSRALEPLWSSPYPHPLPAHLQSR